MASLVIFYSFDITMTSNQIIRSNILKHCTSIENQEKIIFSTSYTLICFTLYSAYLGCSTETPVHNYMIIFIKSFRSKY